MLETLHENDLGGVKVKCIGVGDEVVEHGNSSIIRKNLKLDKEGIVETALEFYQRLFGAIPAVAQKGSDISGRGNGSREEFQPNGKKARQQSEVNKPTVNKPAEGQTVV